jgi:hypothetical protein
VKCLPKPFRQRIRYSRPKTSNMFDRQLDNGNLKIGHNSAFCCPTLVAVLNFVAHTTMLRRLKDANIITFQRFDSAQTAAD